MPLTEPSILIEGHPAIDDLSWRGCVKLSGLLPSRLPRPQNIRLLTLYSEELLAGELGSVSGLAVGTPEPLVGGVGCSLETVIGITG